MLSHTDQYWRQFLDSLPESERPSAYYEAFHFGSSRESVREISSLVLQGIKTAIGSLLWVYEAEGKPIPRAGYYSVVTNGEDDPVCIIPTREIRIIPYDEVDEQFACEGGEEDCSLESWRRMYWISSSQNAPGLEDHPSLRWPWYVSGSALSIVSV